MKISVKVATDVPPRMTHPAVMRKPVATLLQEAMDNIDSGSEFTEEDWCYVRKVREELMKRQTLTAPLQNLLDKIELFMYKYDRADEPKHEETK